VYGRESLQRYETAEEYGNLRNAMTHDRLIWGWHWCTFTQKWTSTSAMSSVDSWRMAMPAKARPARHAAAADVADIFTAIFSRQQQQQQ